MGIRCGNPYSEYLVSQFSAVSGLNKDQFGFYQPGGDGYATLIVAKDNKLISLGNLSYLAFIRNEYGIANEARPAINKFLEMCNDKLQGKGDSVPVLSGNPEYWDEVYKKVAPDSLRV